MILTTDFIINNYDGSKTVFTPDVFDFSVSVDNFSMTEQTINFTLNLKNKTTKQVRHVHTAYVTKDGQQVLANEAAINTWHQEIEALYQEVNALEIAVRNKQEEIVNLPTDENGEVDEAEKAILEQELSDLNTSLIAKREELSTKQGSPVAPEHVVKNKFDEVLTNYVDLQQLSLNDAGWVWLLTEAGYPEYIA